MSLVFKYHLRVDILPGEGVLLLSEDGASALYGRAYERVAALIDGTRDADAIADELNAELGRATVYYALALLEKKGYVVEATPDIAPDVAAFWHSLDVQPRAAIDALRTKAVRVRTVGDIDAGPLREALRDMGLMLTASDEADLTVVLTDDYLREGLDEINAAALATGRRWLLAKPGGIEPWIGPLYVPGETGCHTCLKVRLERNRQVHKFMAERLGLAHIPLARSHLQAPFKAASGLIATEVLKDLAGAPANLRGSVVSLDVRAWIAERHQLTRQPRCRSCGTPGEAMPAAVELQSRSAAFLQDGGHRTIAPEETFSRYEHMVSPITGVVTALERVQRWQGAGYVYRAGHNHAIRVNRLAVLRRSLRDSSSGKGMTEIQAKTSALCEAIERFSGEFTGSESRITGSYHELRRDALHPYEVMRFSERQYRERDAWNQRGSRFNALPDPFDPDARIDWSPVWSLTEKRHKYLPTQLLYFGAPAAAGSEEVYCLACSNGNASGNNLEEAVLQGFFELVERDAASIWWYNRLSKPGVDVASFNEPFLLDVIATYDARGRDVWALDLTTDLGIPVFAALTRLRSSKEERILFGLGCHFDARIALLRAFGEMHQMFGNAETDGDGRLTVEDEDTVCWLTTATLATQPYLAADRNRPLKRLTDYTVLHTGDLLDDILLCRRIVEQKGMEMLVLDQTRCDIGMPVAKVVVPGLRHFWARFGPGRLYEVPVQMGWLDKPLREDELNPIPIFF